MLRQAENGAAHGHGPATGAPPALAFSRVSAGYGGVTILREIDLTVATGEVVAILGRNGVGKTTLVNALFNIGPGIRGEISVKGRPTTGWRTHQIARLGLALVPQGRGTFPNLTVEENLHLSTMWRGRKAKAWTLERVYELFPRLGERRAALGSALSGGERQSLAIARALLTQAEVLVMDEPTEGLAPMAIDDIVATISRLAREGITIMLVEQNVPVALKLASRAVVFTHRGIVYEGSAATLAADAELQREHLGV